MLGFPDPQKRKKLRQWRKENGLCSECGKDKAFAGRQTCKRCYRRVNRKARPYLLNGKMKEGIPGKSIYWRTLEPYRERGSGGPFARAILKLRIKNKWTATQAAIICDISPIQYMAYERKSHMPKEELLRKYADGFQIPLEKLRKLIEKEATNPH